MFALGLHCDCGSIARGGCCRRERPSDSHRSGVPLLWVGGMDNVVSPSFPQTQLHVPKSPGHRCLLPQQKNDVGAPRVQKQAFGTCYPGAILHLQLLLPHATRLWQLYREHQTQQQTREFDRDAAALKADADFSAPSADVAELYTKTYQDGALEPPPGAGWTLYHMAHAVDGLHIIWRRKKPEN